MKNNDPQFDIITASRFEAQMRKKPKMRKKHSTVKPKPRSTRSSDTRDGFPKTEGRTDE